MTSRLLLEYDGSAFAGWARQPGLRTVQGEVERALRVVLRTPDLAVTVAGRTDTGVHALGQVASYDGPGAQVRSLNALLPDDVAVLACEAAPDGFNARFDATSRAYCYRVLVRRGRSALMCRRVLQWRYRVDFEALAQCATALVGTHDFTAFTPTQTEHVRFSRDISAAMWRRVAAAVVSPGPARARADSFALEAEGEILEFWIEADAFMRHMNRVLVGTMLEVAGGRRSVEDFVSLLGGRPRAAAGPTAPAAGLYLVGVGYDGRRVLSM